MKYDTCPVPTSVVRSSSSRIVTYETRVFLAYDAPWQGEARSTRRESGRGKTLLLTFIAAALVIAAVLLGVAAAQADPATTTNQATVLRFTNKVEFGAVQPVTARAKVDRALANFSAVYIRDVFKARQSVSADANLRQGSVNEYSRCVRPTEYGSRVSLAYVCRDR